jgi:hypothetical protein
MFKHLSLLAVLVLSLGLATTGALADSALLLPVTINTSSITGTNGSLDFQFNPGPLTSQFATLEIENFTTDGTLDGAPQLTGDVSGGPLAATMLLDNGTVYNDYFQDFTYGNQLSFDLLFSGPAVSVPDGISTSGSTFAFSMFSDPLGITPVLTSDTTDGWAVTTSVNLDGSLAPSNDSSQAALGSVTPVPEPSPILLLIPAMMLLFGLRYFKWTPILRNTVPVRN